MRLIGLIKVFEVVIGTIPFEVLNSSERTGKKTLSRKTRRERSQLAVDSSRTKNVNDVESSKLEKKVIKEILIICLKDPAIEEPDELLKKVVKEMLTGILNYNWLAKAPKTVKELENIIKRYGLWNEYCRKFDFSALFIPERSNKKGIKKVPVFEI